MSLSAKMRRAPLRAVSGAFILNSGLGKLKADEETAKGVHGMATGTYGFVGKVDPKLFVKGLGAGEVALGAAVLAPFVSPVVAGLGIAGFSGALLKLYWETPGMHEPNDPRPTVQGTGIAKDVWLFGIGVALVADGLLEPAHDKKVEIVAERHGKKEARQSRRKRKAAKKAAKLAAKRTGKKLVGNVSGGGDLSRRASRLADKAEKRARKAAKKAKKKGGTDLPALAGAGLQRALPVLTNAVDEIAPVVADKVTTAAKTAKNSARDAVDTYGPVVAEKAQQARASAKDYAGEYGPVVAEKAKAATIAAKDYAEEHGPSVAERVAHGAKVAREAAKDYADEYGPTVAEKARTAAQDAAEQARKAGHKARERVSS